MSEAKTKVPVSERAVFARVKRKLAQDGEILKKCRFDSRWYNDLGDYYTVDAQFNAIRDRQVPLEAWAREMGLLQPWEQLEDDAQ